MKPFFLILIFLMSCSSKKEKKTQMQFPESPLERACKSGAADTCLALGRSEEKRDIQKAAAWFSQACELKNAIGCLSAGGANLNTGNLEEALHFFAQGCELKEAAACYGTGIVASGVYGGEKNLKQASEAFKTSCQMGLQDGCAQVGILELEQSSSEEELLNSLTILKEACRAKADIACYALGEYLMDRDPSGSTSWFEEGCKLGDGTSCLAAGFAYTSGKGVEASQAKSYDFFQQGCMAAQKDWVACSLFGYADYTSAKNEEERSKAILLLKATCENEAEGCFRMALIDEDPRWLKKACETNPDKCDVYQRYLLKAKSKAD